MNTAFLKVEPWQDGRSCGFEAHEPSADVHCRPFVHGYADVPYHWHREMEILFVLRGSFRLVVDGQTCEMNEEDLIIINADVPHNSASISRDALICGVHLDVGHFERMGLPGFATRHYLCRTFLHSRSFMSRVAPIKAFMARMILDQTNHPEEAMVRLTSANLLACYVYRHIAYENADHSNAQLRSDSRGRILKIMDKLDGRDDNRLLGAIAEAEGLTLSHLSRLFKRHLGIGYRDYSQNIRLDRAAEELRTTERTISTIMEQQSFGNPAVFYNKFRSRFGCSPAEYRRGRQLKKLESMLTDEDAAAAQNLLLTHASGIGKATDLAIGLAHGGKRQTIISAPHGFGPQHVAAARQK